MALIQNKMMKRGDRVTLKFLARGDVTAKKLTYVCKESTDLTADRLIEKRNTLAGGSVSEMAATYDLNTEKTEILVEILSSNTQDLTPSAYPHDIEAVQVDNPLIKETIIEGTLTLAVDVQTPFDGFTLPTGAKRFLPIDANDANVGDLIQCTWDSEAQKNVFSFISIAQLKSQLGII